MSDLRAAILTRTKKASRRFTPDGWPCEVEVSGMSGAQRADFLDFLKEAKGASSEADVDLREFYPHLVLGYVRDPQTGAKVFADSDADALLELPATSLEQIAQAVIELSGLDKGAEARARGESKAASDGSTSSSPSA